MRLLILAATCSIFTPAYASDSYIGDLKCRQNVNSIDGLILEYMNPTMSMQWHKIDDEDYEIFNVKFAHGNYVFRGPATFAKVATVQGKDKIHHLLRSFQKKYGSLERVKGEHSCIWETEERTILLRRFSVHLGQVEIYCRDD